MSTNQDKNFPYHNFGDWLKSELARRGWNQRELIRRAGITPSTVSLWVTGEKRKRPDLRNCIALAMVLELPWQTVVTRAYPDLIPPAPAEEETAEIAYLWGQLSPDDKERIRKMLRGLMA